MSEEGGMKVSLDTALKIVTAIVLVCGIGYKFNDTQQKQADLIVAQGKLILQQGEQIKALTSEMAFMRQDVNDWKRATTNIFFKRQGAR